MNKVISHDEMIKYHSDNQISIETENFNTKHELALHSIHSMAYNVAALLAEDKIALDLGCNVGYGSKIISKRAKNVIGVDVSEKSIKEASLKYQSDNIEFKLIDGKTLPFPSNTFDIIISCQVIEHIIDYEKYLSEVHRVLKNDGLVFFTTPNAEIRLDPGMKPWYEFHHHEFNRTQLNNLLKKYFAQTEIYGLRGSKYIYEIEIDRVTALLNEHRKQKNRYSIVNKLLNVYNIARYIKRKISDKLFRSQEMIKDNFIDAIRDCYLEYQKSNINTSIDLLAICNKNSVLKNDVKKIIEAKYYIRDFIEFKSINKNSKII